MGSRSMPIDLIPMDNGQGIAPEVLRESHLADKIELNKTLLSSPKKFRDFVTLS